MYNGLKKIIYVDIMAKILTEKYVFKRKEKKKYYNG